jgi:hypothetical protein
MFDNNGWIRADSITSSGRISANNRLHMPVNCIGLTRLSVATSCLKYPTRPRQALWRCCMPSRAGKGSGARQKPKSTT